MYYNMTNKELLDAYNARQKYVFVMKRVTIMEGA